jgi:hypothetical protein
LLEIFASGKYFRKNTASKKKSRKSKDIFSTVKREFDLSEENKKVFRFCGGGSGTASNSCICYILGFLFLYSTVGPTSSVSDEEASALSADTATSWDSTRNWWGDTSTGAGSSLLHQRRVL